MRLFQKMKRNEFDEIIRTLNGLTGEFFFHSQKKEGYVKINRKNKGGKHGLQHKDIRKNVEPAG